MSVLLCALQLLKMSRILAIFAIVILANYDIEAAPVAVSKQYIPPLPGFIPVYIRPGNTPLEDINADLAEAFHSYALKHDRLPVHARTNEILTAAEEKKTIIKEQEKRKERPVSKANKTENHGTHAIQVLIHHEPQHIQKIQKA